jgi:hypothetical protein
MVPSSRYLEAPQRLRAFVRAHETSLAILAALIGVIGGLVVAAMSAAVSVLHAVLFNLEWGQRLSSQFWIDPVRAILVPTFGGLLLGVAFLWLSRWRPAREVESNNDIRREVGPALASLQLASPTAAVRLAAAEELANGGGGEAAELLRKALGREQDGKPAGMAEKIAPRSRRQAHAHGPRRRA